VKYRQEKELNVMMPRYNKIVQRHAVLIQQQLQIAIFKKMVGTLCIPYTPTVAYTLKFDEY
jgi:hypothetical protein